MRKRDIHFIYVIGILVAVILIFLTKDFGSGSEMTNYISFFSGLASIILAIIAIIYAYVQNASINNTIYKLGDTAEEIHKAAKENKNSSEALNEIVSKIEEFNFIVETNLTHVREEVSNSNEIIKRLEEQVYYFKTKGNGDEIKDFSEDFIESLIYIPGIIKMTLYLELVYKYFSPIDFDSIIEDYLKLNNLKSSKEGELLALNAFQSLAFLNIVKYHHSMGLVVIDEMNEIVVEKAKNILQDAMFQQSEKIFITNYGKMSDKGEKIIQNRKL